MSTTEDRARAAMRAIGATVSDAPPLPLTSAPAPARAPDEIRLGGRALGLRRPGGALRPPDHGDRRRRRSLLAPVAAAVTVVAVAVALVAVRHSPAGGSGPAAATLPGGVPRYYVAVKPADSASGAQNTLQVGDALTGKVIATFTSPKDMSFESVSGATDDRTLPPSR